MSWIRLQSANNLHGHALLGACMYYSYANIEHKACVESMLTGTIFTMGLHQWPTQGSNSLCSVSFDDQNINHACEIDFNP